MQYRAKKRRTESASTTPKIYDVRTIRPVNPADIRRWAENHRAAAARELAELRPLSPTEAFASAMALLEFDERLNGSPFDRDDSVTALCRVAGATE